MQNIKVKALQNFKFKGASIKKGDEVSMSVSAARSYGSVNFVKLDSDQKAKVEANDEKVIEQLRKIDEEKKAQGTEIAPVASTPPVKKTATKTAAKKAGR